MISQSPTKTIGEAIIVLGALASFTFLAWSGNLSTGDSLWMFAGMLGVIVLFYFLLLLARAIFTFMTGGDTFWWEKYEDHRKVAPKK